MIRMMNISDGKRIGKNRTGNPSMSVGAPGYAGGMLMGLLAKGSEPFNSAGMTSFMNGYAGDRTLEYHGYGMVASNVVDKISEALKLQLEKVL